MSSDLKQFLARSPAYHEFEPVLSTLVNLDVLQVRQAFYQEISEKLIFVFVLFQYEKTADLSSTFLMNLPLPALATINNAGMFGVNGGPILGDNQGPTIDLANSRVTVTFPDVMGGFPVDGVASIGFYYIRS